jgi:hypothetical protein
MHNVFPLAVADVLSNLQHFACLRTLSIRFSTNFDKAPWLMNDEWRASSASSEEVLAAETRDLVHSLMNQTYGVLSRNVKHRIIALQLRDMKSVEVSAFHSEAFHIFIHSIQRFELSMKSYEPYYEGHLRFTSRLGLYFFDHLQSVVDFASKVTQCDTIGIPESRYESLILSRHHLPFLKRLRLDWVFIGPSLVEFLVRKSATLECISLHECSARVRHASIRGHDLGEHGVHWRELFTGISDAKPSRLRQFILTPHITVHNVALAVSKGRIPSEDSEAVQGYPENRSFSYVYFNWEQGGMCLDRQKFIQSSVHGDDQKAYESLMETVGANASRLSKT